MVGTIKESRIRPDRPVQNNPIPTSYPETRYQSLIDEKYFFPRKSVLEREDKTLILVRYKCGNDPVKELLPSSRVRTRGQTWAGPVSFGSGTETVPPVSTRGLVNEPAIGTFRLF
jgi:hypothetical protein